MNLHTYIIHNNIDYKMRITFYYKYYIEQNYYSVLKYLEMFTVLTISHVRRKGTEGRYIILFIVNKVPIFDFNIFTYFFQNL